MLGKIDMMTSGHTLREKRKRQGEKVENTAIESWPHFSTGVKKKEKKKEKKSKG